MAYFVRKKDNVQLRVDSAGNAFIGKKCVNHMTGSVEENGKYFHALALTVGEVGLAVNKTGQLDYFEYGHTRDENGNPTCTKVHVLRD